jgi:hypothetical protein
MRVIVGSSVFPIKKSHAIKSDAIDIVDFFVHYASHAIEAHTMQIHSTAFPSRNPS